MFKSVSNNQANGFAALYTADDWTSLSDDEWQNLLYNAQTENPEFYFAFADHQEKPQYEAALQAWESSYEDGARDTGAGNLAEDRTAQSVTGHSLLNPNIEIGTNSPESLEEKQDVAMALGDVVDRFCSSIGF